MQNKSKYIAQGALVAALYVILTVIFGALATLIGAYGTRVVWKMCANRCSGKARKVLAGIPPIVSNTLIIPWILSIVYKFEGSVLYFSATVFWES